jgi:hypothetical protein
VRFESAEAVGETDEIVAVEGVDMVLIGVNDMLAKPHSARGAMKDGPAFGLGNPRWASARSGFAYRREKTHGGADASFRLAN